MTFSWYEHLVWRKASINVRNEWGEKLVRDENYYYTLGKMVNLRMIQYTKCIVDNFSEEKEIPKYIGLMIQHYSKVIPPRGT